MREDYIEAMLQVAARDPSIAGVLREICALDGAVRSGALELVRAHLRTHAAAADVLECVQALSSDDVARRVVERLGPPG
jgi:DNA-binding FrmR family transcriptional regulator